MYRKKVEILMVLLLLWGGILSSVKAQTLTASAAPSAVAVGQELQVEFTVNAEGTDFTPPDFKGFSVVGSGTGGGWSGGSGGSGTVTHTFIYFLVAKAEGTFTIAPASIKCNGKTISSNTLTIKVTKGVAAQPQQAQTQGQSPQGNSKASGQNVVDKKNFFIRIVPSKTKAYVGEEISVTLKVYYRVQHEGGQLQEPPDYSGFYTEDIPQNQKSQVVTTRETVNGLQYNVDAFPQKILFPQRPGKLKIGGCTAQFILDEAVREALPFGGYITTYERVPAVTKSEPVSIEVLPLPKTAKVFSGAVGELTLKSELDKDKVKANDAINLTITFSGSGNLKLLDTLPLQFPPDFDKYDPKITDHLTVTSAGVSGSRSFNYLLIPRHPGKYKIPPLEFTYFNTRDKAYVTLALPEFNIDVDKGDNNSSSVTVSGPVNKEDVKMLGSDIRYIHPGHESFYRNDSFFLYSFPFLAGIILPLLLFAGFVVARKRYMELHKDTIELKRRGATKMAKKRLKTAQKNIAAGNKEIFYSELLKALNGYFSDKFTIPLADLSRDTISANLTRKNVKEETLQMVNKTLDDCEFARYAPGTLTGNLEEVYASAVKLITLLEDEIS